MENSQDISLESTASGTPKFCELWPGGRQALQALQELIKNPIAKASVGIVIGAGNAVYSKKCGGDNE